MCGIVGFISKKLVNQDNHIANLINSMTQNIRHRGPDGFGCWVDPNVGVGLGHARLAVRDLSDNGRQPMVSSCGRIVITFNGEIYNSDEIKAELYPLGRTFRGTSDTEVLLEAIAEFGLEKALFKCIGMFALAVWDTERQAIFLARDRLGKKPLYYKKCGTELVFGSELSALEPLVDDMNSINRDALAAFLVFGYVPDPKSIFDRIEKLAPGNILSYSKDGTTSISSFWSLENVIAQSESSTATDLLGDEATIDAVHSLIGDSVERRLVADVPVGIFLSGGLDSTIVAAVAKRKLGEGKVKTFSIGFNEGNFDESTEARRIAQHLGTRHYEKIVTSEDALACIDDLPKVYDEPFADSSQIPTLLLSRFARNHVTVALSGDGGDEVFGGYNRYLFGTQLSRFSNLVPRQIRALVASLILSQKVENIDKIYSFLSGFRKVRSVGDKAHKLASILSLDEVGIYCQLLSQWPQAGSVVTGSRDPYDLSGITHESKSKFNNYLDWMRYTDCVNYLPYDILTKVDRASMASSLEVRSPLLDHRLMEMSWRLDKRFLVRSGQSKWLLRQVLKNYIPRELTDRPKMGFGIPLGEWLRGPLLGWSEDLLQTNSLLSSGMLDPEPIKAMWNEHKLGARNWQYSIWNILMFQNWFFQKSG